MRSPLRVKYRKNRLFNPIKVDCFLAQTDTFETQLNNIHRYHIRLALDSEFKISPKINENEYILLNRFDIFSYVRSSVIIQLRFKIANFKMLCAQSHNSRYKRCFIFNGSWYCGGSSAAWYTHSGTLSNSTLYWTDMPTWRGEPFIIVAMCGAQCFWSTTPSAPTDS